MPLIWIDEESRELLKKVKTLLAYSKGKSDPSYGDAIRFMFSSLRIEEQLKKYEE